MSLLIIFMYMTMTLWILGDIDWIIQFIHSRFEKVRGGEGVQNPKSVERLVPVPT